MNKIIVLASAALLFGYLAFNAIRSSDIHAETPSKTCDIKGDIVLKTGRRVYHMPGQRYYGVIGVNPKYGERWFCSEAEAIAAGWSRSKQ